MQSNLRDVVALATIAAAGTPLVKGLLTNDLNMGDAVDGAFAGAFTVGPVAAAVGFIDNVGDTSKDVLKETLAWGAFGSVLGALFGALGNLASVD